MLRKSYEIRDGTRIGVGASMDRAAAFTWVCPRFLEFRSGASLPRLPR
jgi:hypothetical protein